MQRNDILTFLQKIDTHLHTKCRTQLKGRKFELNIFGKSALLLAGLTDSFGTKDIDLLKVEGQISSENQEVIAQLEKEFGRSKVSIHGYYLEFVSSSMVLLPHNLLWTTINENHQCLSALYLEASYVIASKLFSAFSDTPRKQDKQDIVAALDQKLVNLQKICKLADEIFERYKFDSRSDRFSDVHNYICNELMEDYGKVDLNFKPN